MTQVLSRKVNIFFFLANLTILDGSTKPTESEINAGLKAMQDAFDARDYARKRAATYPSLQEQMDMTCQ